MIPQSASATDDPRTSIKTKAAKDLRIKQAELVSILLDLCDKNGSNTSAIQEALFQRHDGAYVYKNSIRQALRRAVRAGDIKMNSNCRFKLNPAYFFSSGGDALNKRKKGRRRRRRSRKGRKGKKKGRRRRRRRRSKKKKGKKKKGRGRRRGRGRGRGRRRKKGRGRKRGKGRTKSACLAQKKGAEKADPSEQTTNENANTNDALSVNSPAHSHSGKINLECTLLPSSYELLE